MVGSTSIEMKFKYTLLEGLTFISNSSDYHYVGPWYIHGERNQKDVDNIRAVCDVAQWEWVWTSAGCIETYLFIGLKLFSFETIC